MADPNDTISTQPHALYRFFDAADVLLYVGITCNPASRWAKHQDEKEWWHEVARISVEKLDGRDRVLKAEAEAIRSEKPKYNIKHNVSSSVSLQPGPKADYPSAPFSVGDVVALGMRDGNCPLGMIRAYDGEWVRLDLMSHWDGSFGCSTAVLRVDLIESLTLARVQGPEEIVALGWDRSYAESIKWFDTDPLCEFQAKWKDAHGGTGHTEAWRSIQREARANRG